VAEYRILPQVSPGLHSNDLRGTLTNVDALATENQLPTGNRPSYPGKDPAIDQGNRLRGRLRSEPLSNLKLEGALFVLNLNSEATFSGDEAVTTPGRPSQRRASS